MLTLANTSSILMVTLVVISGHVLAHDPVFGPGPHVIFKGGIETALHFDKSEAGTEQEQEAALELTYGLTGDWAVGVELPYVDIDDGLRNSSGIADVSMFTKYRFWRNDTLGAQDTASVFLMLKPDTAGNDTGTDSNDAILGLTYGYESRKWYRWASVRYRYNGENGIGLQRGDKVLVDLAVGIRLKPTGYLEPDTVWLLELNGEYASHAELNGLELSNTGGSEWFLSPGIFWTYRNFAVKAGVQIPVAGNLNGEQAHTDFRVRLVLEWHL